MMSFQDIDTLFQNQMEHYLLASSSTTKQRIALLTLLETTILEYRDQLVAAVREDFGKPITETELTELFPTLSDLRKTRRKLSKWMRPERRRGDLLFLDTKAFLHKESKGVCLIIAPWNYPILLVLKPLVAALAAGNTVIVKPSELTPNTANTLEHMLKHIFPPELVSVVQGGVEVSKHLTSLPFHHIHFTGSPRVGKSVMAAAAQNLTSVTLELGGKSPCVVQKDADLDMAAERIAWGKFINGGQTCIAPDYILCHYSVSEQLIRKIENFYTTYFEDPSARSKIIDQKHSVRLNSYFEKPVGTREDFPLQIVKASLTHPAMQEEIFGPVLPVLEYSTIEEARKILYSLDRPLAAYVYEKGCEMQDLMLSDLRSGALVINHNLIHFSHPNLPFGGVNNSGLGRFHGYEGFKSFSNLRSVLKPRWFFSTAQLIFPPYTRFKKRLIDFMVRYL